jgi:hypothetical protein
MRAKALGYGVVLALVIASIALQVSFEATDATRFATIVLQAATLVAACWWGWRPSRSRAPCCATCGGSAR